MAAAVRWAVRLAVRLAVIGLVLAGIAAGGLVLLVEDAPAVRRLPVASPEVAVRTRDVVHRVRALDEAAGPAPTLVVSLAEIRAVLDFAARLMPGARGQAEILGDELVATASVPVPLPWRAGPGWLNLRGALAGFEGEGRLASAGIGPLEIPPGLATALGEAGANLVLGGGTGTRLRAALRAVRIAESRVTVVLHAPPSLRSQVTRRAFGTLRRGEMPDFAPIEARYRALREAIDAGLLPTEGSFLPYLRHLVRESAAAGGDPDYALTAGLFAMAKACGAKRFGLVAGRLIARGEAPAPGPAWVRDCTELTLRGQIDKRRHFITAAAIRAASTMRMSFAIGEFKELVDSTARRGVFDFTDIVANASGIRFADTFLAAPVSEWEALLGRIRAEDDVIARFDGVPGEMRWAAFEARFDRVDSPAYAAMVERIEARIDALALHEGRPRPPDRAAALRAPGRDDPRPPAE